MPIARGAGIADRFPHAAGRRTGALRRASLVHHCADLIVITHTHRSPDRTMVDKLEEARHNGAVGLPVVIDTLNSACSRHCGSDQIPNTHGDGHRYPGRPMYNLVFGSGPGKPYHHKGIGSGYILTFGDTRVYFSGDTECTPEIKAPENITVAFLSMNPPRTETPADAAAWKAFASNCLSVSLSWLESG